MRDKRIYIIALFGTLLAVFWQELNLFFLNGNFPESFGLITCADEASYLRPPQNLLKIGIWKDSSTGITSYFLRPPGYGIYFLCLKIITGEYVAWAMKFFQILFYFFTILLVSKSLYVLNVKQKFILIFTSIFAFLPCFSGFMYFTVTESISPFFTLLSTYYWLKMRKNEKEKAGKFILSSSFLILIRPQLLIFILLFCTYLFLIKRKKQFYFSLLAFLPFIIWNIRTVYIAKEWMGIHPIYSNTNNSLYRPNHEKMTNLFRIWEYQGDIFHTAIETLAYDTSSLSVQKALTFVPEKYQEKVKPIFTEYHNLKKYQLLHFTGTKKTTGYFKGETEFNKHIEKLTSQLKSENKFDNYLLTPFKSLKKLLISSHLNLSIFQDEFRGSFLMESLRWLCVLMIISIFSISCLNFFRFKFDVLFFISFGIFISLLYLSYIQRMNEERYLTPIIPLAFIVLATSVSNMKVFKRLN